MLNCLFLGHNESHCNLSIANPTLYQLNSRIPNDLVNYCWLIHMCLLTMPINQMQGMRRESTILHVKNVLFFIFERTKISKLPCVIFSFCQGISHSQKTAMGVEAVLGVCGPRFQRSDILRFFYKNSFILGHGDLEKPAMSTKSEHFN